eukprot:Rmarinus@m.6233
MRLLSSQACVWVLCVVWVYLSREIDAEGIPDSESVCGFTISRVLLPEIGLTEVPFTPTLNLEWKATGSSPTSDGVMRYSVKSSAESITEEGDVIFLSSDNELLTSLELPDVELSSSGKHSLHFQLSLNDTNCGPVPFVTSASKKLQVVPGWLSLTPPIVTLLVSGFTQQVLLALACGVWLAAMLTASYNPFTGFLRMWDKYLVQAIADPDHASILLFSFMLGGLICVVSRCGGAAGLAELVVTKARNSQLGQLCTLSVGLSIFFDDYANSLITGSTMRPITDRLRISREKLAFIVDATAAPIASVAPLSSWIGFELGLIQAGFEDIGIDEDESPYIAFLQTIPKRFYSIHLLFFVFIVIVSGRDFGPMHVAEQRARQTGRVVERHTIIGDEGNPAETKYLVDGGPPESSLAVSGNTDCHPCDSDDGQSYLRMRRASEEEQSGRSRSSSLHSDRQLIKTKEGLPLRWYNAAIPVGLLVLTVMLGLLLDGYDSLEDGQTASIRNMLSEAHSFRVLIWAGVSGMISPIVLLHIQGLMSPKEVLELFSEGMKDLFEPLIILIFAWSLGNAATDVGIDAYLVSRLGDSIPIEILPMIIFCLSAFLSFSTGSSWGTMSIMFPLVIPLAWETGDEEMERLLDSIASILAGSVFGDHCSPISDTTVLSSLSTQCPLPDHWKTQVPYAVVVGVVSTLFGSLFVGLRFYEDWAAIIIGFVILAAVPFVIGKPVDMYTPWVGEAPAVGPGII